MKIPHLILRVPLQVQLAALQAASISNSKLYILRADTVQTECKLAFARYVALHDCKSLQVLLIFTRVDLSVPLKVIEVAGMRLVADSCAVDSADSSATVLVVPLLELE